MALKRMDNVLIVVDDLEAVKAFFIELGLRLEGEMTVEGPEVGSQPPMTCARPTRTAPAQRIRNIDRCGKSW